MTRTSWNTAAALMDQNHDCVCVKSFLFIMSLRMLLRHQLLHGKIKWGGWLGHLSLENIDYTKLNIFFLWNLDILICTVKGYRISHFPYLISGPFCQGLSHGTNIQWNTFEDLLLFIKKAARQHNRIIYSWTLNKVVRCTDRPLTTVQSEVCI